MVKTASILVIILFFISLTTQGYAQEPYKIGGIFAITGPASSLGIPERDTALMLEDEINKKGGIKGPDGKMHPLKLIIYDTKSEETSTVLATKKLIEEDKVSVIVGPSQSGETLAIVDTVQKAQIPLISCAAAIKIVEPVAERKWVFKTPQSDYLIISILIDYLKTKNIKKVAWMNVNNAFGDLGRIEFEKAAPQAGITAVAKEKFEAKDADMTPQLTRIKGTDAQAVVVWSIPPSAAVVTKNYKDLGIGIPLFQSHGVGNKVFIDLSGAAANGVKFPVGKLLVAEDLPDSDAQKKVLISYGKAFEAKYGTRNTFGGHAWDAVQIAVRAMEKAGNNRAKIRDAVESLKNFVGISGVFNFSPSDHNGLDKRAVIMVEIADGKWRVTK